MANYNEQKALMGKWADKSQIKSGMKCCFIDEVEPSPSAFKDKSGNPTTQDVGKLKIDGFPEAVNVSVNRTTINGLVRAFGKDSKLWIKKLLFTDIEQARVGGKMSYILYLIPDGFEKVNDENGYAVIVKSGEDSPATELPPLESEDEPVVDMDGEEIKAEDLPF